MIRKLLCWFGLHSHVELVDEVLTKQWLDFCPAALNPTPCTYLKCKYCGHEYFSRTVGISGKIKEVSGGE